MLDPVAWEPEARLDKDGDGGVDDVALTLGDALGEPEADDVPDEEGERRAVAETVLDALTEDDAAANDTVARPVAEPTALAEPDGLRVRANVTVALADFDLSAGVAVASGEYELESELLDE